MVLALVVGSVVVGRGHFHSLDGLAKAGVGGRLLALGGGPAGHVPEYADQDRPGLNDGLHSKAGES